MSSTNLDSLTHSASGAIAKALQPSCNSHRAVCRGRRAWLCSLRDDIDRRAAAGMPLVHRPCRRGAATCIREDGVHAGRADEPGAVHAGRQLRMRRSEPHDVGGQLSRKFPVRRPQERGHSVRLPSRS
eukprot:scaffold72829_cov61-Phaeocystis_antarctica.AAC.3